MASVPNAKRRSKREPSAREEAIRHLIRIDKTGAFVGLGRGGAPESFDMRHERAVTEYVAGVTRWRRWLDFLIQHFYKGKAAKMELALRQVLRLALYDLLVLETPPHAALNEAVGLAKRLVRPRAGALVNGILRAVLRQQASLPIPNSGNRIDDLATLHSHPTWMVKRWIDRLGEEDAIRLLHWNNARPDYSLRVNTLQKTTEQLQRQLDHLEIPWEESVFLDEFVRVRKLQAVLRGNLINENWCAVQDESSGLIVRLLDPIPGSTMIDACAAPGGKTLFAAERMQNSGHILAYDIHDGRLNRLTSMVELRGVTSVRTEAVDLRELAQRDDAPLADFVLLDAPCSGLGVLAKRADLRWNRSPEDLHRLGALQDELLNAASNLVRPGGVLVYSTCTIAPEENQHRVEAFLARSSSFQLESGLDRLPPQVVTPEGFLITLPHQHRMDGVFGARLRRIS